MSTGIVASVLEFIGLGEGLTGGDIDGYDDYDEYGDMEEYVPPSEEPDGVYKIPTGQQTFSDMAILRAKPETIDEAPQVANQIKDKYPVIVNLEDVPDAEARRIVDFLGGVVYGIDGSMKKVARSVFVCTPYNMPIEQLSISPGRGGPIPGDDEDGEDLRSAAL